MAKNKKFNIEEFQNDIKLLRNEIDKYKEDNLDKWNNHIAIDHVKIDKLFNKLINDFNSYANKDYYNIDKIKELDIIVKELKLTVSNLKVNIGDISGETKKLSENLDKISKNYNSLESKLNTVEKNTEVIFKYVKGEVEYNTSKLKRFKTFSKYTLGIITIAITLIIGLYKQDKRLLHERDVIREMFNSARNTDSTKIIMLEEQYKQINANDIQQGQTIEKIRNFLLTKNKKELE